PPAAHAALCGTDDACAQLETAVRFICHEAGTTRLSIIAHSWGSMPTCRFAGRQPTQVDRLVLFGPIARRPPRRYEAPPSAPAWRMVSPQDQWARFVEDLPPQAPSVLSRADFGAWGERYLDSDPDSRTRNPPSVKIPTGPFSDILKAWHGQLAYDPALVQAPGRDRARSVGRAHTGRGCAL